MIKEIPGYGGKYSICSDGQVMTVRRKGSNGGFLSQRPNSSGYMRVELRKGKEKRSVFVHRLVAMAFVRRKDGCDFVNHIDGNKKNNSASNLEWCTRSQNMKHAIASGLNHIPCLSGSCHPMHKLTEENVKEILMKFKSGSSRKDLSEQYGVTREQISNIVNRKHWKDIEVKA